MRSLPFALCLLLPACAASGPAEATTSKHDQPVEATARPEPVDATAPTPEPEPEPAPEPVPVFKGVDLTGLDTSCKRDGDCTHVSTNKCGPCGCANTPLARAAEAEFRERMAAVDCSTYPKHTNPQIACGGCPGYEAWCDQGQCAVRMN